MSELYSFFRNNERFTLKKKSQWGTYIYIRFYFYSFLFSNIINNDWWIRVYNIRGYRRDFFFWREYLLKIPNKSGQYVLILPSPHYYVIIISLAASEVASVLLIVHRVYFKALRPKSIDVIDKWLWNPRRLPAPVGRQIVLHTPVMGATAAMKVLAHDTDTLKNWKLLVRIDCVDIDRTSGTRIESRVMSVAFNSWVRRRKENARNIVFVAIVIIGVPNSMRFEFSSGTFLTMLS